MSKAEVNQILWILCENIVSGMSWNSWKAMVLVKYHLPIIWNKYFLTKNIWYHEIIFSLAIPVLSLKLSFMSPKHPGNLNIFTAALFIVYQMTQYIVLTVQCFDLRRNKVFSVLLSTITFHKNQILNIENPYH